MTGERNVSLNREANDVRTVLITGGGSGIGYAAARLFLHAGYRVLLTGRTASKIDQAILSLKREGKADRLRGYTIDVADKKAIEEVFSDWEEEGIVVDTLVNNAGVITPIASIIDSSPEEWMYTLQINLYGCYLCARYALPGMLRRGGGTIINIGSGSAHRPLEGWSTYCSSKAGLYMFTACLHEEYGSSGVRIFSYRPGMVDTPMQETIRASGINRVSRIKREELISPEFSARGIFYLAQAGDEYLGKEVDIRDLEFSQKISALNI